jgi:hypothetical protein
VVERLAAPDQDWMLDEFGMHQGEDVHAEAFVLSETLLHLTISEFEIHYGDSILLDLHDTPGKEPWADVAVTRESDCGAGVPWERLGGWVRINSDRWSDFRSPDAKPLVVEFWLSGLSSGCESCLHGTVVVPK